MHVYNNIIIMLVNKCTSYTVCVYRCVYTCTLLYDTKTTVIEYHAEYLRLYDTKYGVASVHLHVVTLLALSRTPSLSMPKACMVYIIYNIIAI